MAFKRGWAETQLPSASILLGKAGAAFYLGVGRMQDQALSTTGLLPTSELSASHVTHTQHRLQTLKKEHVLTRYPGCR